MIASIIAEANLPPVPDGHMRVFRVEKKSNPMKGGQSIMGYNAGHHWHGLPCPWGDSGIERGIKKEEVCAATVDQVDDWWPPETHEFLAAMDCHMVVLDVPANHVAVGRNQVLVVREKAVLVSVLLH